MAFRKDWTKAVNGFGELTLRNAYCKVTEINGSKYNLFVTLSVQNKEIDSVVDTRVYNFVPSLEGENFIAQAYDYLKTLPEFANAVDC
jgi:hypothetical protein